MLRLVIPSIELFDEVKEEFIQSREYVLQLEHSLVSIAKWEARWNKPFLSQEPKTTEETLDYIECMTITQNINKDTYRLITVENIKQVNEYIDAPMTATVINTVGKKEVNREIVTAELIYYWMITLSIPFECQKWHLNRLLTLIQVCNIKNAPKEKMNRKDILKRNKMLNAERRKQANTRG